MIAALLGGLTVYLLALLRGAQLGRRLDRIPAPAVTSSRSLLNLSPFQPLLKVYQKKVSHLLESMRELGEEAAQLIGRHELLTENLAAAIVMRDANGKITYCSPFTEVLTGYSVNEIYQATDGLYSDLWRPYRLRGRRALPPAQLTHAERWVLFLRSSIPLTAKFPNQASHAD